MLLFGIGMTRPFLNAWGMWLDRIMGGSGQAQEVVTHELGAQVQCHLDLLLC